MPADEGQRAGVVAPSSVLSEQQRDEILRALLSEHPIAMIAAIQDNGLFCPMPVSVPVSRQSTMSGRSALDVVLPADQPAVISAWDTVKERGASQVSVDLLGYPPVAASLRFVDMRHRHGVLLGVCIVTGAAAGGVGDAEQARVARPRYTRWVMTDTATITAVDDAASVLLGYAPEDLLGRRSSELIHPDEQNVAIDMWMDMLARPGVPRRSRSRHRHADGRWIWMETVAENLLSDPEQGCVIVEKFDISEEMAAQEALRAREQLLHRLAEALPLGVVQIDLAGDVVYANDRLAEVLGVSSGTLSERLAGVLESDRAKLTAAVAAVLNGEDEDLELRLRRGADEELRRVHLAARPLTDDQGSVIGAIASVSDVTDSVRLREQLHERATFDPLTRCFNRAAILAELDRLAVVQIPAQADPVEDATDHVRGDGGPSASRSSSSTSTASRRSTTASATPLATSC